MIFVWASFSKSLGFRAVVINQRVVCFFLRSRELFINIFIITSTFYISYIEPLFVVVKIIGLPGSSTVNNFVRDGPVIDVVSHVVLSPTVASIYFLTAENWYKIPAKIWAILFRGGHRLFALILAVLLLTSKLLAYFFILNCFKSDYNHYRAVGFGNTRLTLWLKNVLRL